jgi:antitoxin (DNA-binding transcriptional repressor) of toxin-antitoxin stability system
MNKKTIAAGQFKAICLKLMDKIQETGMEVIITKRKVPIVKLSPVLKKNTPLFGKMKGTVHFKRDIKKPIEEKWNADY